MLKAKLVVVGGDAKLTEIPLRLPTTIGRSREAKVKLCHPLVSRNHCEIFERQGKLFVRDLGSLNGTYVDSHRIEGDHPLARNQLLTIGTVTFRAIYDAEHAETPGRGSPANGRHESLAASSVPAKKSPAIPPREPSPPLPLTETQPAPAPAASAAEPETEATSGSTHDTDASLDGLSEIDFVEVEGRPEPVISNVLIEASEVDGHQSVSLSALEQLPTAPGRLSFAGGIRDLGAAESQTGQASSLPIIETDSPESAAARAQRRDSIQRSPK